jgi:hypothetical protein
MSEEKNEKRCSGCKTPKPLDNFYKNKLVLDGHSNYCIDCTRENSKKYFQRKKMKISKIENDTLLKMAFLNSDTVGNVSVNAENLMKIMMIEKMIGSITTELSNLKNNVIKSENIISQ